MNRLPAFITILTSSLLALASHRVVANQAFDSPPEIQVEVIIFSQQDFYQNEYPSRNINLSFPANGISLTDPTIIEEVPTCDTLQAVPENEFTNPDNLEQQTETDTPESIKTTPAEIEPSYVMLAKEARQLNPDAYTLNRAAGYRVLFHQAWRQPNLPSESAPWLLIRSGEITGDHFELEGAIRLYQSRYPHFQADIWKSTRVLAPFTHIEEIPVGIDSDEIADSQPESSNHAPVTDQSWPDLPNFPKPEVEIPEPCPEPMSDEPAEEMAAVPMDEMSPQESVEPETVEQETAEQETIEQSIIVKTSKDTSEQFSGFDEPPETLPEKLPEPVYQTENLAYLKQSSRVDYEKITYLDHPNLGILIKVSEYKPLETE